MSLRLLRLLLFASFVPALPGFVFAQPTPSASLLALSKQDHTLAIVDPVSLQVLARIPVGDDPHEVVASADGQHRLRFQLRFRQVSHLDGHRPRCSKAEGPD